MSCLRLRKIRNPKKEPTGLDKPFISIPDGNCPECMKRKTNDWLVRCYYEYISKPNQQLFFVSFDFDDEHLPKTDDGVPCFDYSIYHSFVLNLRNKLPYFRYVFFPHFGDAFDRPHIHGIFFFEQGATSPMEFYPAINKYWKYGSHINIQSITSARSPLALCEYCCSYAAQGHNYTLLKKNSKFTKKQRPQIYASIGFGCQCLDPKEFKSDRLLNTEGYTFLPNPVITKDFLKNNHTIPIPKDDGSGTFFEYTIPRFYELKLMFDSYWDSVEKKQSLKRNEDGYELSLIRHNSHYNKYFEDFVNSKFNYGVLSEPVRIIFKQLFPDSPYNGLMWPDIVDDVLLDKDNFIHYLKGRDFLELYDRNDIINYRKTHYGNLSYYFDSLRLSQVAPYLGSAEDYLTMLPKPVYAPFYGFTYYFGRSLSRESLIEFYDDNDIGLYIQATFMFDLYNYIKKLHQYDFKMWKMSESRKAKIRNVCMRRPSYRNYLISHNFNFNSLISTAYVPFSQITRG